MITNCSISRLKEDRPPSVNSKQEVFWKKFTINNVVSLRFYLENMAPQIIKLDITDNEEWWSQWHPNSRIIFVILYMKSIIVTSVQTRNIEPSSRQTAVGRGRVKFHDVTGTMTAQIGRKLLYPLTITEWHSLSHQFENLFVFAIVIATPLYLKSYN